MDLNIVFNTLEKEYKQQPYLTAKERIAALKTIKVMLQNHAYDFANAISSDFSHRPQEETLYLEVFPVIRAINYCIKNTKRWMKHRKRHVSWIMLPAKAYLAPQPLGVVGVVAPWNYPLYLALVPTIYALAAGNRVMIKMSEFSPKSGALLEQLTKSSGLESLIQVINGDVDIAAQFTALPFGHLFFTGSPAVGRIVMKAASDHLTPVTLELGGKSPALLSKTMNTAYFKRLFMGKLYNAGQTCVAPDYLLIPEGWESVVEEAFHKFLQEHYPDLIMNSQYASIISERHVKRLSELVEDARNQGAKVTVLGEYNDQNQKLPMHLLFGVTDDMRVMKEEIFGPVLPIRTYKTFDEALDFINSLPNPLALYYFGEDKTEKQALETRTLSGALTINETILHIAIDDLPFGGVGNSGMGHTHGQEGFDTFSKLKPVMIQSRLSPAEMLYPPYGVMLRTLIRWLGGIKPNPKKNGI